MPKKAVIIVAGGTGTRMELKTAKQFLDIGGKPILIHTFEAFATYDPSMQFILVLYPALKNEWKKIIETHQFNLPHEIVDGGEERFHSVKNGLQALSNTVEVVAIHDAVRPFVSQETIQKCMDAAQEYGAAIPVLPVTDTIREIDGTTSNTLPRHRLVAVQTPQCFKTRIVKTAYQTPFSSGFTDDASVVEATNHPIQLVTGNRTNVKITTREDLVIGEALMTMDVKRPLATRGDV